MKQKREQGKQGTKRHVLLWSGLQARMTLSYVKVTVMLVLIFVALAWLAFVFVATMVIAPFVYTLSARDLAGRYALAATLQADAAGLNPKVTFRQDQPDSLTPPGKPSPSESMQIPFISTRSSDPQHLAFALLIAPDSRVLASSYPARYPVQSPVAALLPHRADLIVHALAGTEASGEDSQSAYAIEPVWGRDQHPIGAIYLQLPASPTLLGFLGQQNWLDLLPPIVLSSLFLLVLITPIGGLFGLLTTRGIVRRLRRLATATTHVATGTYTHRVSISRSDEIGELERQFNRMTEQLEESITGQRKLTEQNARLAERERISRELHDAISQELFSLRLLAGGLEGAIAQGADLRPYVETLEQATDAMIREMRALLLELRPVQLEELGLARALEELALAYSTRLGINVSADMQDISLHEKAQHALFRIAQEALANAVRHADATVITLALHSSPEQIEFVITDNGKGFELVEEKTAHGLGLSLMQERVRELGGILSIHSTPGEGTRIAISLPHEDMS